MFVLSNRRKEVRFQTAMSNITYRWRFASLGLLVAAFFLLGQFAVAQDVTIVVIPSLRVEAQESQTLDVEIRCNAESCSAFAMELAFDPAIIRVDQITLGPFLGQAFMVENMVDMEAGRARLSATALGTTPTTGSGELFTLTLTGIAPGTTRFDFASLEVSDAEGNSVSAVGVSSDIVVVNASTPTPSPSPSPSPSPAENQTIPEPTIAATTTPYPAGGGIGLIATYFRDISFTSATRSRIDRTINFNWGQRGPLPNLNDQFSARWRGFIQPLYSDLYTLYLTADDGARLYIDDQLVIDAWETEQPGSPQSSQIMLTAGQLHKLLLEYRDESGSAMVKLEWESGGQGREVVPSRQLYPAEMPARQSAPTPTPTPTPVPVYVVVTVSSGNLRSGPGVNYGIIGTANQGETYLVVAQNEAGDWFLIDYNGEPAWISLIVAEPTEPDVEIPLAVTIPAGPPTARPPAQNQQPQQSQPVPNTQGSVDCSTFRATSPLDGFPFGSTVFYWDPAAGAESYRVTIFNATGAVAGGYQVTAPSTSVVGDASQAAIGDGYQFSWQVQALQGGQVACTSGPFAVMRSSAPTQVPAPRRPEAPESESSAPPLES